MSKPVEEILSPKPEARPRVYAYSIDDKAHAGLLKIGQTTRNVQQRVAEQLRTAAIKNYRIEFDGDAARDDGSIFSDHEIRAALVRKGFDNPMLEWVRCTLNDVKTVHTELRTGQRVSGTYLNREQARQDVFDYIEMFYNPIANFNTIYKDVVDEWQVLDNTDSDPTPIDWKGKK